MKINKKFVNKIVNVSEEVIEYEAIDGTIFDKEEDCIKYEEFLKEDIEKLNLDNKIIIPILYNNNIIKYYNFDIEIVILTKNNIYKNKLKFIRKVLNDDSFYFYNPIFYNIVLIKLTHKENKFINTTIQIDYTKLLEIIKENINKELEQLTYISTFRRGDDSGCQEVS